MSEAVTVKFQESEEQYPLLKMAAEVGDTKIASPKRCFKKAILIEYSPACCLALLLVTVSIMTILSFGTAVVKRQPLLFKLSKDKHTQRDHRIGSPPVDVFMHKIVQDRPISFDRYSLYLSDIAVKYPSLRFHVFFLIDDSQYHPLRHYDSRIINKLFKNRPERFLRGVEGLSFKRDVTEFTKQHDNVNVTIVPLSEYMENSPMRYKWRTIPNITLQFYCGVHAVWKYGGIAVDMDTFSDDFKELPRGDDRINTIFERYNEGLGVSKKDIDRKKLGPHHDESFSFDFDPLLSGLRNLLSEIIGETTTIKKNDEKIVEIPLVRKHRNKRDVIESVLTVDLNKFNATVPLSNATNPLSTSFVSNAAHAEDNTKTAPSMATDATPKAVDINTKVIPGVEPKNTKSTNKRWWTKDLSLPGFMLIDIFESEDDFMPYNSWPFTYPAKREPTGGLIKSFAPPPPSPPRRTLSSNGQSSGNRLLVADVEGRFIATAVRYHPFLGRILFPLCYHSSPRFAFESVLSANCYGPFEFINCADVYFL